MPPLIDDSSSPSANKGQHLSARNSDVVKSEAEDKDKWIETKVSIAINLVELGLHYGLTRDASLATMQVIEFDALLFKLYFLNYYYPFKLYFHLLAIPVCQIFCSCEMKERCSLMFLGSIVVT